MSGFELVFALFGLVLGLAITEVLAGFSRVLKMRREVHVGWLVPLLGLVVLLDLTAFWSQAYDVRNVLSGNLLTLNIVMAIVGAYYLLATLVFPDQPDKWPDFDVYYDRINRKVLGGMLAINFATLIGAATAFSLAPPVKGAVDEEIGLASTIVELAPVLLIVALLLVKNRRWNVILLLLLAFDFLAMAVIESV